LLAACDWDLTTRDGLPVAYRLSIAEAGGARSIKAAGLSADQVKAVLAFIDEGRVTDRSD
jgi:hypothetical protein